VNAELSDFVACGGYDPAAIDPTDDDWLAGDLGIIALFYGCIERIHINV